MPKNPSFISLVRPGLRSPFRLIFRALAVFLVAAVLTGCGYRYRPLYQPQAISVNKKVNVQQAIRDALKSYEWIVERDTKGEIIARQTRRSHVARVKITYTNRDVHVSYFDSENLLYEIDKDGKPRIHSTYNRWVQNLERGIAARLN